MGVVEVSYGAYVQCCIDKFHHMHALTAFLNEQAGVYPNVLHAARSITDAAGVRGLFTGYLPNLLEDVPDMAFKFAAYESMRGLHRRLNNGRSANVQVMLWLCEGCWICVAVLEPCPGCL